MKRERFYNNLIEFLSQFDYLEIEAIVDAEIFSLGNAALEGITACFRCSVSCLNQLPASPFTVPGGKVFYALEQHGQKLVLRLEVER